VGVKQYYEFADIKAAFDRSEGQYIHLFRQVWGATQYDWTEKQVFDKSGKLVKALPQYKGPKEPTSKADPGHTFEKHVGLSREPQWMKGSEARSFYANEFTAIKVTQLLLNGSRGQAALRDLDSGAATDRKIVDTVPAAFYGGNPGDTGASLRKIGAATCCIMKLGDSTLWIHTSYPSKFS
jgi:hypothetical protein